MEVNIKLAYDQPQDVIRLFTAYTNHIISQDPEVAVCLMAQQYDKECSDLLHKYSLPHGRLYLADLNGDIAGCVALRQLDDRYCEMKRLYVRPEFRGKQIGKTLMEQIIADAKAIGYHHIRLDTFPVMENAIGLYRSYGFYDIARYNNNPASKAVFMQLDL